MIRRIDEIWGIFEREANPFSALARPKDDGSIFVHGFYPGQLLPSLRIIFLINIAIRYFTPKTQVRYTYISDEYPKRFFSQGV